ncbi:MAG: RidA family protein [candidate division WOR-3 bacterium]
MIKRSSYSYPEFKIFLTEIQNTYLCITGLVTEKNTDPLKIASAIYDKIAEILTNSKSEIIHERIFGNIEFYKKILKIRNKKMKIKKPLDAGIITYIEGKSCFDSPFSGIQIRSFSPTIPEEKIEIFKKGNLPIGRIWNRNGAIYIQLQSIEGKNLKNKKFYQKQAENMFRKAEALLKSKGASYRDVVRTWIYVDKILDWYNEFNLARNTCYKEFGLIPKEEKLNIIEEFPLPASTGIGGKNPKGASTIMDLLAVSPKAGSKIQIRPLPGTLQCPPYKYGSAFARATCVVEPEVKWIFVSGTASINEKGESIHLGDFPSQVKHTIEVVKSLISLEGASIKDLCEATIFIKRESDFPIYQEISKSLGLSDIPALYLIADVCREELLFELEATFALRI